MSNKRGALAISQILILVLGIIAFSILSSEFVGAQSPNNHEEKTEKKDLPTPSPMVLPAGALKFIDKTAGADKIKYILKEGKAIEGTGIKEFYNQGDKWFYQSGKELAEVTDTATIDSINNAVAEKNLLADTSKTKSSHFGDLFKVDKGGAVDSILTGAKWAAGTYLLVKIAGGMFGLSDEQSNAAATAAAAGMFVGQALNTALQKRGVLEGKLGRWVGEHPGKFSFAAGAIVAAIVFYAMYKKESQDTITFTCDSWQAPTGGSNCEKCNQQRELPCSEYQCRSLGQACQLLNQGTQEEKCAWVNRHDVDFPIIEPLENALLNDYEYKPDNTISPPDRGVKVHNKKSTTGCVKAFTPLTFGIELNEPAQCKLDYLRKDTFDEMDYSFGGSTLFRYNHTQVMSLPGPSALESQNLTIYNDGKYEIYTRCQDANGNKNTANFVFTFCVEAGPDTTAPLIVTTNLLNNMPIAYNQTEVELEVYVNEPAECKWSHLDQTYDDMEETMSCSSSVFEMNAQMLYKCTTTLTGLKNNVENKFYFRCRDQPTGTDRNVNSESYEFILIGTQPLVLSSVGPNGTVKDSTENVKVTLTAETSAGYKDGKAMCYYSDTGDEDTYIMFFETESHEHSQDLYLTEGDYEYFIKCMDLGGNADTNITEFTVESDLIAPLVVRTYHEESYLKLVTDEEAECVYDTVDCNYQFDDGTKMSDVDGLDHFTNWNTKVSSYVKCKDEYGNQPAPNECSIIVRPFDVEFG